MSTGNAAQMSTSTHLQSKKQNKKKIKKENAVLKQTLGYMYYGTLFSITY